jgi:hypothetical protein
VLSFGCVGASIPMYLFLPTEWSAEVAFFFRGALQSVVILVMISDKKTA